MTKTGRPLGSSHDHENNVKRCAICDQWLTYDQFYTKSFSKCKQCLQKENKETTTIRVNAQLQAGQKVTNNGNIKTVEIRLTEKPCYTCKKIKPINDFSTYKNSNIPFHDCLACLNEQPKTEAGFVKKPDGYYKRKMSNSFCACGCGEQTKMNDKTNTPSKFAPGHWAKTKPRADRDTYLVKQMLQNFGALASDYEEAMVKLKEQNFRCAYTQVPIQIGVNASMDHIIPNSRKSRDKELCTMDNLVWCDSKFNLAKHDLTINDLYNLAKEIIKNDQR